MIAATSAARAMLCPVEEVNFLSGPGRGVILIKIDFPDDKVIGALVSTGDRDLLTVETSRGASRRSAPRSTKSSAAAARAAS